MIVLHAGLAGGALYLWGEISAPELSEGGARGRRGAKPVPYRYDAGVAGIRAACAAMEPLHAVAARSTVNAVIRLPFLAGMPVPSSPLVADPPLSRALPVLRPCGITAVELLPAEVAGLMAHLLEHDPPAPGIVAGTTLKFWAQAFRLAARLVVRGEFLPGILYDGAGFQACWEPMPGADAVRHARMLAGAMPDACRALSMNGASAPATPQAALDEFLAIVVDALVLGAQQPLGAANSLRGRRLRHSRNAAGSFDEKWLHALGDSEGRISCRPAEFEEFSTRLAEWKRPLLVAASTPFRLCFRLEEPGNDAADSGMERRIATDRRRDDGGAWNVRYLLQSTDDPSLLIDVARVWDGRADRDPLPGSEGVNLREYLLGALGRASRLLPDVRASLDGPAPGGYTLDTTNAYRFLQDDAGLLERGGFAVLLPAWWTRRGVKHLTAKAIVQSSGFAVRAGLTLDAIAAVDWEIALGGEPISQDELRRLARLKAPLVRMRGQWVELDPEAIDAALRYWQKQHRRMPLRDVVRMALGADRAPGGLEVAIEAGGAVGRMLDRLRGTAAPEQLPVPAGFHGTLRPYQERGYAWLHFLRSLGFGACLADDMGLGKTIQALVLLAADRDPKGNVSDAARPALLVCPTSVMWNWRREAERFTPDLPVMMHHGAGRMKESTFVREAGHNALVITSYALLHRDLALLRSVDWAGVILDEAQNIKNPETRQAQAARALHAGYRIALTGTPVENHVGDLWSIMEFLNPGFLGSRAAFRREFLLPVQAAQDAAAAEHLKKLTGPFILRRMKTDPSIITDLPAKQEMKVFCTLTREQASLYKAVVDEMAAGLDSVDGIQRQGMVLAGLLRLKQVCNHPAQFLGDNSAVADRSGKLNRLTEMLEEVLASGDRALVFTQFAEMGAILKHHLQETFGVEVLLLHGATPVKQREAMVQRFQSGESGTPIFVLSLKAGGSGLNLTAASHVFHFDRWWNPAVESQATDRAFRIGQRRNVQVHSFICAGTVEEKIDEMIERKQSVAATVVGSGESMLAALSTAELKKIIMLRTASSGE
ncbi:MAG: DEAD/DEAH box helicase [Bacteroidetes bacterium]|nr:DEAD/DEAH box helicase [Bacteroidota bacterium]